LRHRHETHSIVCTKYESKGIMEKFTVLMRGHTKWSLRVLWNVGGCKGNPVRLRKSLRLAGGNPKNDISGYNTQK
jgi:hypothetical protein